MSKKSVSQELLEKYNKVTISESSIIGLINKWKTNSIEFQKSNDYYMATYLIDVPVERIVKDPDVGGEYSEVLDEAISILTPLLNKNWKEIPEISNHYKNYGTNPSSSSNSNASKANGMLRDDMSAAEALFYLASCGDLGNDDYEPLRLLVLMSTPEPDTLYPISVSFLENTRAVMRIL